MIPGMPQDREIPLGDAGVTRNERGGEPSFGELVSRLTNQTGVLIRQEIALAKVELRETGATVARDSAKAGAGVVLAWTGMLALTTALILGLAQLFDNYWLAALIVGAVYVLVGWMLAKNAMADVRHKGLGPKQTMETLRDDADWAKEQTRSIGDNLKR
jgi:uncharacterized membrane protein YqjE